MNVCIQRVGVLSIDNWIHIWMDSVYLGKQLESDQHNEWYNNAWNITLYYLKDGYSGIGIGLLLKCLMNYNNCKMFKNWKDFYKHLKIIRWKIPIFGECLSCECFVICNRTHLLFTLSHQGGSLSLSSQSMGTCDLIRIRRWPLKAANNPLPL